VVIARALGAGRNRGSALRRKVPAW